jgi:hypothetical protein
MDGRLKATRMPNLTPLTMTNNHQVVLHKFGGNAIIDVQWDGDGLCLRRKSSIIHTVTPQNLCSTTVQTVVDLQSNTRKLGIVAELSTGLVLSEQVSKKHFDRIYFCRSWAPHLLIYQPKCRKPQLTSPIGSALCLRF